MLRFDGGDGKGYFPHVYRNLQDLKDHILSDETSTMIYTPEHDGQETLGDADKLSKEQAYRLLLKRINR